MVDYKHPGVYVEEISTLPANIPPVETAIPAFIGYTERVEHRGRKLLEVPTRISSLLEYEQLFGGAASVSTATVTLDGSNGIESVKIEPFFYMFDSLRLFFDNGGGNCYIVSVGEYRLNVTFTQFNDGLTALEAEDEPTLILFPDAVKLVASELSDLQNAAMEHCAKLKDRFAVLDLQETQPAQGTPIQDFRTGISIENLSYGAAYWPWLEVVYTKKVTYDQLNGNIKRNSQSIDVLSLAPNTAAEEYASLARIAFDNKTTKLPNSIGKVTGQANDTLDKAEVKYEELHAEAATSTTPANSFNKLVKFICEAANQLGILGREGGFDEPSSKPEGYYSLREATAREIENNLAPRLEELAKISKASETKLENTDAPTHFPASSASATGLPENWSNIAPWTLDYANIQGDEDAFGDSEDKAEILRFVSRRLRDIWNSFYTAFESINQAATNVLDNADQDLKKHIPIYRNIVNRAQQALVRIPPSGAIAGVYASVDRERGVWKAPANRSLRGVSGLTRRITDAEQNELNINPVAGKSINAIRAFTGKGILVWGARTLAGNDAEWRYVNVRRLYLMVEESIAKAMGPIVFEPNTASTWMRVKTMIESFLNGLWRQGALAGAKPDHAYFVNVGLGVTMTAQDILEGRLIVEVGMAAVRPAEFIVLRFSHKMQTS